MSWLGGLLGGLGGALGGIGGALIQSHNSQKIADKNNDMSMQLADKNYERQKEFAQNGLKWSVDQAKELGLNPLLVTGGATFTPSSSQVFSPEPFDCTNALSQMGQSVGRAISAVMSPEERAKKSVLEDLNLEHARLRNDYVRAQISAINARLTDTSNAPSLPNPSSGPVSAAGELPDVIPPLRDDPRSYSPRPLTPYRFVYDHKGVLHRVFTEEFNDSIDSDWWSQLKFTAQQAGYDFKRFYNTFIDPLVDGSFINSLPFKSLFKPKSIY